MMMRTLDFPLDSAHPADIVLIVLPGAFQQPEDLLQHGLVDVVREENLPIDVVLADPEIGSTADILDGTVLRRLHDLTVCKKKHASQRLWLAGISIGGLIALRHAVSYSGAVDGIWLLAPYPGNRMLLDEIRAAGGARHWADNITADDDGEAGVWRWLAGRRESAAAPFVYLTWGKQDRFAAGQALLADALPPACSQRVPGAHDWPAWELMWRRCMVHAADLVPRPGSGGYEK